jgi:serine protease AprX
MNRRRLLCIGAALLTVVCAAPSLAQLPLPLPSLSSLTLSPASVTGGSAATGTVTLNGLAPAGGALVTLSSSDPAVAVPASVTISLGATSATFSLTTSAVAMATPVTVSAFYLAGTQTASLSVMPPIVSSLTVSPASVTGGSPATGTVTLNGPASVSGALVTLSSSNPAVAVPASVAVSPAGTSATFSLTTSAVATSTPVTISASGGGGTQTTLLTVLPSIVEGKIDPALRALMQAYSSEPLPVIVEMRQPLPPFGAEPNADQARAALALLSVHGTPVAALSLINAAAGVADAAGITALSLEPTVEFIHHDRIVGPRQSAAPPPATAPDQVSAEYPRIVRARQVWQDGITGKGVTVAVLDSGVAPDMDLMDLSAPKSRILGYVNFTDPSPQRDPGGHGTHVAGIIAGNGQRSDGEFVGIAPQANIVDVRVLRSTGSGRMSSVIRGIEWTLAHRKEHNIRVINLSFGARNPLSYRADPLSAAVEIAWRRGLVVVAAAGNEGPERGKVVTPGIDPYVITVGATDDRGTRTRDDDVLAWFSAWGDVDSNPKPDLVAPGRRLVSVRVEGSTLDTHDRVVVAPNGSTYLRLTGTSMSTGVVSGAAALLLERNPSLTPDQVKALLVRTTQPYGVLSGQVLPDPIADGSGLLDAFGAAKAAERSAQRPPPANTALRPSDGFARAMYPVLYGSPLRWKDPFLGGILWNLLTWETLVWNSVAWDNFDWDSVAWDSVAWDSVAWDSVAWDSVAWDSVAWDSVAWDSYTLD